MIEIITWGHIIQGMVIVLFLVGVVMAVLYLCSKWFDSEKNNLLWGKLMSLIVQAEYFITGEKKGEDREKYIEEQATQYLSFEEKVSLEKFGGVVSVVRSLFPYVKLVLPMVFKK